MNSKLRDTKMVIIIISTMIALTATLISYIYDKQSIKNFDALCNMEINTNVPNCSFKITTHGLPFAYFVSAPSWSNEGGVRMMGLLGSITFWFILSLVFILLVKRLLL